MTEAPSQHECCDGGQFYFAWGCFRNFVLL